MFVHFEIHAFNKHACNLLLFIIYFMLYVIIDTQHQGIGFLKVRTEIIVNQRTVCKSYKECNCLKNEMYYIFQNVISIFH